MDFFTFLRSLLPQPIEPGAGVQRAIARLHLQRALWAGEPKNHGSRQQDRARARRKAKSLAREIREYQRAKRRGK